MCHGAGAAPCWCCLSQEPLTLCPQSSLALPNGERARSISEYLSSSKKRKVEEKDFVTDYVSPQLGHPCPLLSSLHLQHPSWERGSRKPLWLQLSSAFQGSDADKSEDNLVVDEVSAPGGWEGAGGMSQLTVAGVSLCSCLHYCS